MKDKTKRRIDSIIRSMVARDGAFYWNDDLGICGTIAAEVRRACQQEGLRVARRDVNDRVEAFCFGEEDQSVDPRLGAATNLQTNPAKYFVVYTPSGVYAYDAEDATDALRILGECVPGIDLLACRAQSYQDILAAVERYQALPEDEQGPAMLRDAFARAVSHHVEIEQLKRQKPF